MDTQLTSEASDNANPAVQGQFVGYPRPTAFPGTPEQLEALADAYFAFQWVFICNALLFAALWFVVGIMGGEIADFNLTLFIGVLIVTTITGLLSLIPCRTFAYGLGCTRSHGVGTAIVLGLQSCLCFGLFGFSSVMRTTANELTRYGIHPRFWGFSSADVAVRAAEMRTNSNPPPPAVPTSTPNPEPVLPNLSD
jgi:hypothetical protein